MYCYYSINLHRNDVRGHARRRHQELESTFPVAAVMTELAVGIVAATLLPAAKTDACSEARLTLTNLATSAGF
jgi:hypothetical protein